MHGATSWFHLVNIQHSASSAGDLYWQKCSNTDWEIDRSKETQLE